MSQNVCIILLVNIVFYWKTIYYGYVSDDLPATQRNYPGNIWKHALLILEGHLKSHRKGKDYPHIDHFITFIIHAFVCVGIYLGFGGNNVSFIASLLFSVNPINNQVAVWIAGRNYAFAALGMVWALALPMEMGGLMLLGATYSNAGFLMPVVLLGSSHPYLFIFAPLVWLYQWKRFNKNVTNKLRMEMLDEDKSIHVRKLILATKTFGFYLIHALIPIKTTFYHSLLESIAGSRRYKAYNLCRFFWIGVISICAMIAYICTHKWDMVCFGILWWCVGILPFLNLRRIQQEIAERYAYVANIGLMVCLGSFIVGNDLFVAGFLMMYATKMWFYIDGYKSDFWMVETSTLNSPDSWFGLHIAATKRFEAQSYIEAIYYWNEAKRISPNEFKLLYNLAVCSLMLFRNTKEANSLMAEAEKNIPKGQEVNCKNLIISFKMAQNNPQAKLAILI